MTLQSPKSRAIVIPSRAASASAHRAEDTIFFFASHPPKWPSTIFLITPRLAEHKTTSQAPSKLTLVWSVIGDRLFPVKLQGGEIWESC
ncbi:hypothetical protein GBA52_007735 [Prunus armeniaca]|nr:hypothetical protein GBA52_007735 [Prunus armeniaca]